MSMNHSQNEKQKIMTITTKISKLSSALLDWIESGKSILQLLRRQQPLSLVLEPQGPSTPPDDMSDFEAVIVIRDSDNVVYPTLNGSITEEPKAKSILSDLNGL